MENKVNLEWNRVLHQEDSMVMYSIYNSDTLEQLIDTNHKMHNKTTWNEKVFAGKIDSWYLWYLSKHRVAHYAISSLFFFLTMSREKYVKMYKRFINWLQMYAKGIRILSKGYFPISLLPPSEFEWNFGWGQKGYSDSESRL